MKAGKRFSILNTIRLFSIALPTVACLFFALSGFYFNYSDCAYNPQRYKNSSPNELGRVAVGFISAITVSENPIKSSHDDTPPPPMSTQMKYSLYMTLLMCLSGGLSLFFAELSKDFFNND